MNEKVVPIDSIKTIRPDKEISLRPNGFNENGVFSNFVADYNGDTEVFIPVGKEKMKEVLQKIRTQVFSPYIFNYFGVIPNGMEDTLINFFSMVDDDCGFEIAVAGDDEFKMYDLYLLFDNRYFPAMKKLMSRLIADEKTKEAVENEVSDELPKNDFTELRESAKVRFDAAVENMDLDEASEMFRIHELTHTVTEQENKFEDHSSEAEKNVFRILDEMISYVHQYKGHVIDENKQEVSEAQIGMIMYQIGELISVQTDTMFFTESSFEISHGKKISECVSSLTREINKESVTESHISAFLCLLAGEDAFNEAHDLKLLNVNENFTTDFIKQKIQEIILNPQVFIDSLTGSFLAKIKNKMEMFKKDRNGSIQAKM